ncbi:PKD domain-containing protein [Deminuibacter soli]|uniref:PKD domain-containing protein n=1 Tax=Deminuibacter soli TaxID=2291815 RepID=A0A3E1NC53_9BACT|nr:PKD domain-containing protein [Deminuibacter soli]RFM25599.1 PKD domain-containing protein [Deminuibacter soli]
MSEVYTSNKPVKTGSRNMLYLYILLGVLVLALVFVLLRSLFKTRTVEAHLLRQEIYLNEPLVYTDNTNGAEKWVWEFGNGDRSLKQNGSYHFRRSGSYIVRLTIDDNLRQQFPVIVKDTVAVTTVSNIAINGVSRATVNEQVRLDAEGDANIFDWSFGETNRVDAHGRTAFYTYHTAGSYTVTLKADKSSEPVFHTIIVAPPFDGGVIVDPGAGAAQMSNDFRDHLQAIANGKDFNTHYGHLVRNYLCQEDQTTVQATDETGSKKTSFYSYCMGLTFGRNIVIDDVGLTVLPNKKCVSAVTVQQHKKI